MYRLFYIETVRGNKYLQIKTVATIEEAQKYEIHCLTDAVGKIIIDNRMVHNA